MTTMPDPTAHSLTLLFHRFLSETEWRQVVAVARTVPWVQELIANVVVETPEELARQTLRPWPEMPSLRHGE